MTGVKSSKLVELRSGQVQVKGDLTSAATERLTPVTASYFLELPFAAPWGSSKV